MGMTDRQFDAYQLNVLSRLKRALEEVSMSGGNSPELQEMIKEIETQLSRP